MRVIVLATLLVGAFATFAAGCGGDSASAEDTVSAAISGLSKGDSKKVCSQLTAAAEKKLLVVLADNPLGYPDIKAATCEEAITKLHAQLDKPTRAVLEDGEVDKAKVNGDKATVHVTGAGMTLDLQKISDRWMITGGLFGK
jgi:hypothetical protein